jgi:hypothetical protein
MPLPLIGTPTDQSRRPVATAPAPGASNSSVAEVSMEPLVLIALLALVCGLLAVIVAAVWWPVPTQHPLAARESRRRATRGRTGPVGWLHEAPDIAFTVPEAGQVLQRHRQCHIDRCARKSAAFRILLAAGHLESDAFRRL